MSKKIIVTGASRGIGKETALDLAKNGHSVWILARTGQRLHEVQQKYPDQIRYKAIDLTDENSIKQFADELNEDDHKIDALINNAGALINKPFSELSSADWQKMLDANLMSTVHTTKYLLPLMAENSHIVNISSMGGFQGSSKFPGLTAYSVAKGSVSILTECLAAECSNRKVSVNALCLGSVQTEMFNQAFPDFDAATQPKEMGTYIADFSLNCHKFYNGKVLPVALQDPS